MLAGYNVLTSSAIVAGANSDDNGHGTEMASAAAATANNSKGIVGVAYQSSLIPVKALDSAGTGLGAGRCHRHAGRPITGRKLST